MKKLTFLTIFIFLLIGCQSRTSKSNNSNLLSWNYSDLRILDPIDAQKPEQDLIALYTRMTEKLFQIRLDFLELGNISGQDIYILFDTNPGGQSEVKAGTNTSFTSDISWNYMIKISAPGNIMIVNDQYQPVYGMALLVVREPSLQSLIMTFNLGVLPISISKTNIQVILSSSKQAILYDKSNKFSIDAPSPSRVNALFLFWNTFPSSTPAQAMRSWAGAHSGPASSRHGLKYLLEAADERRITLFLPDLINPDRISRLDYMNVLPYIERMINEGLISIICMDNGINNGDFVLLWNDYVFLYCRNNLMSDNDYAQLFKDDCQLLPGYKQSDYVIPTISLACKSLLLSRAITQPTLPLIFGGDFSKSYLGDPVVSKNVFSYIVTHPWIHVLSADEISNEHFSPYLPYLINHTKDNVLCSVITNSECETIRYLNSSIQESIANSPSNEITNIAKRIYQSMFQSASDELITLRFNYLGQIGNLLMAAKWAEKPTEIETCTSDIDYDGQNECILSNERLFMIIDPVGGYIPFVFYKDEDVVHQLIGPTWQFTIGLSDPSTWDLTKGILSDTSQILGAFSDSFNNWRIYRTVMRSNSVILESEDLAIRKSVFLYSDHIHIDMNDISTSQSSYYIPLVVDPWIRFIPNWGNQYSMSVSKFTCQWGLISGEKVDIVSNNISNCYAFNDTKSFVAIPEDPNYDYPAGHYLPFPIALAEIRETNNIAVDILIKP